MRNKPQLAITIDADLDERLRELKAEQERPLSYFVNNALRSWLSTNPETNPNEADHVTA